MTDFEVKTEYFQGPLAKLLELIESKKLEISRVSLAEVTSDFLAYLKTLEEEKINPSLLADFLVVASYLVLLKSKELLPNLVLTSEEEESLVRFEWGLKIYKELKSVSMEIKKKWSETPKMFIREFMAYSFYFFYPPQNLTFEDLNLTMQKIYQNLEVLFKPVEVIKNKIINLKEKIEEIFKRVTEQPVNLRDLSLEKNKSELVVLFLAILHLIKDRLIEVKQESDFGDILIFKPGKNKNGVDENNF